MFLIERFMYIVYWDVVQRKNKGSAMQNKIAMRKPNESYSLTMAMAIDRRIKLSNKIIKKRIILLAIGMVANRFHRNVVRSHQMRFAAEFNNFLMRPCSIYRFKSNTE